MAPANSDAFGVSANKAIEQMKPSLKEAGRWMRDLGWNFYTSGHGRVAVCPSGDCKFQLNSTPGNPDLDAKRARDVISRCQHLSDPPPRPALLKKIKKKLGGR